MKNTMISKLALSAATAWAAAACNPSATVQEAKVPAASTSVSTQTTRTAAAPEALAEAPKLPPAPTFEAAQGECPEKGIQDNITLPFAEILKNDGLKIANVTDKEYAGATASGLAASSGLNCTPNYEYRVGYYGVSEIKFNLGVKFTGATSTTRTEEVEEMGGKLVQVETTYKPQKTIMFEGFCQLKDESNARTSPLVCQIASIDIKDGEIRIGSSRDSEVRKGDKIGTQAPKPKR